MKNKNSGFTLIELMIVIAILGVLASIAYPSYSSYVKKGNRADGIDSLLSLAGYMEEYYLNNDTYANSVPPSTSSSDGLYTVAITEKDGFAYLLTATPVKGDPACGNLTLNSLGQKGVSVAGATVSDCW